MGKTSWLGGKGLIDIKGEFNIVISSDIVVSKMVYGLKNILVLPHKFEVAIVVLIYQLTFSDEDDKFNPKEDIRRYKHPLEDCEIPIVHIFEDEFVRN